MLSNELFLSLSVLLTIDDRKISGEKDISDESFQTEKRNHFSSARRTID